MNLEERVNRFLNKRQLYETVGKEDIDRHTGVKGMIQALLSWAAKLASTNLVDQAVDSNARVIKTDNRGRTVFEIDNMVYSLTLSHLGTSEDFVMKYEVTAFNESASEKIFTKSDLKAMPGTSKAIDIGSVAMDSFKIETNVEFQS